jgi:hypothetical protein
VTPCKAIHLCTLLSFLETGKLQRLSSPSQWLNPTQRIWLSPNTTNVSYSWTFHLISYFYYPEDPDEDVDEGSDNELDDDTPDGLNRKAEIMDVSHHFSTIRAPYPDALFRASPHISKGNVSYLAPFAAAVNATDVEATEQILAMHELCDPPFPVNPHSELDNILQSDSPALLDFLIRKFGIGIGVSEEDEDEPRGTEEVREMPKTYLGLDVHGVKRKDLVKRNDPDAPQLTQQIDHIPLLWFAANKGASKTIDWLATSAPLEAYKAFMSCAPEEDVTAKALNKFNGLEAQLPELLGFLPNELGETAVFAALLGQQKEEQKLAIVKQLYKLLPHLKDTFTASRVKGTEVTPILLVCGNNYGKDLFDFFLSHGANPMEVDQSGYEISSTRGFSDIPQLQYPPCHVLIRRPGTPPICQPEAHRSANVDPHLSTVSD